jgi:hypothetical protein
MNTHCLKYTYPYFCVYVPLFYFVCVCVSVSQITARHIANKENSTGVFEEKGRPVSNAATYPMWAYVASLSKAYIAWMREVITKK